MLVSRDSLFKSNRSIDTPNNLMRKKIGVNPLEGAPSTARSRRVCSSAEGYLLHAGDHAILQPLERSINSKGDTDDYLQ